MEALIEVEEIKVEPLKVDLVRWNAFSIEAEKMADAIVVTDDEENAMAANSLTKIKQFNKDVESARKETVEPLNALTKRVNNLYRPITDSLERAKGVIESKIKTFMVEKERIRREEEARRQKEFEEQRKKAIAEAKKNKTEPVFVEPPKPLMEERTVRTGESTTTISKSWKGEVSEPMDILKGIIAGRISISVVEFKKSELNNYAKVKKQEGVFDGIKVFEESTIISR